jgi:hypothetical protein
MARGGQFSWDLHSWSDRFDSTAYYRLKVYNTNGTFFFSPIILLKSLSFIQKNFIVSPSPFGNVLKVSVSAVQNVRSVFKLVSVEGKTVFFTEQDVKVGVNRFSFDIPTVAPGIYIIMMSDNEGTVATKVLKQ